VTSQYPEQMRKRLTSSAQQVQPQDFIITAANLAPPPWRIEIPASDGTMLLVLREEDGRLVAEGDESRWDEAAKRFVGVMMQWAGGYGIRWKDEARRVGGSPA
jgi:hypothetical protein